MQTRRFLTTGLWLLIVLLALGACNDRSPPVAVAPDDEAFPPELEQTVRLLRADLEASGYEIAQGYWTLWDVEDCQYPLQTMGFCYGNNPVAPYAIAVLPRWHDEFEDLSLHHAIMEVQPNYRLDEREALVVLAQLPPPGRYFGLQTNVFTREVAFNEEDPFLPNVSHDPMLQDILFAGSPNPARRLLFSSIGNSINNVVIEDQSEAAFDQQRYFIITSDESMAEEITAALLRADVETNHVFTEPVSPYLVNVGLGPEADDLITYIRYALPEDAVAGQQWRERLPLTILRVRDTSGSAPEPFAIPDYEPRTFNYDEHELAADLDALLLAVQEHWQQQVKKVTDEFFSAYKRLDLVGQHCLGYPVTDPPRGPMNCLGDTQDTDYQISPLLRLDKGQDQAADPVIAVVGVLATETGNATYTSLSVNRFPALVGVKDLSNPRLKGTAAKAGFGDVLGDNAELFYVYYLARDCSGLDPCLEISRELVSLGETIRFIQRNYVVPGSRRGPDPYRLLNPFALVFDGSRRP
jgi:hypothetical protein